MTKIRYIYIETRNACYPQYHVLVRGHCKEREALYVELICVFIGEPRSHKVNVHFHPDSWSTILQGLVSCDFIELLYLLTVSWGRSTQDPTALTAD